MYFLSNQEHKYIVEDDKKNLILKFEIPDKATITNRLHDVYSSFKAVLWYSDYVYGTCYGIFVKYTDLLEVEEKIRIYNCNLKLRVSKTGCNFFEINSGDINGFLYEIKDPILCIKEEGEKQFLLTIPYIKASHLDSMCLRDVYRELFVKINKHVYISVYDASSCYAFCLIMRNHTKKYTEDTQRGEIKINNRWYKGCYLSREKFKNICEVEGIF